MKAIAWKTGNAGYRTRPIEVVDGIPVFSVRDRYVDNYVQIASDHVKAMRPGFDNPFIENDLWQQLDASTRELIKKHVPRGSRLLDIGVGLGRVLAPLTNYERFGIDISLDYLRVARDAGIDVAFARIEDMPYEDGSFDAVVACDVLEHVFDLHECCRNILRVLRPGGVLIARVPLKEDLDVYLREDLPYEYIHLRNFDEASLRLLFGKTLGLQFLQANAVAPYLQGLPRLKLRLLPEESRARMEALAVPGTPPLSFLRQLTQVSSEGLVNWLYQLRDQHSDEYKKVVDDLVLPMDINVVFKKAETSLGSEEQPVDTGHSGARSEISDRNSEFWNELCGSQLAKSLGITDTTAASLKKFDDWYFAFYPYLFDHIPFDELNGKDVLEVGLGYGTVSQRLAEAGVNYRGLDIAAGPVGMVNHRLQQAGLSGWARQGSILKPPFCYESFDAIVAIGCLHHTGDMQLAIQRCWDLLRPGGRLIFMVYHAYSYRRFRIAPMATLKYVFKETVGYRGVVGASAVRERAAYDSNSQGAPAPHTDWISMRSLQRFCDRFSSFRARLENIDQEPPFTRAPRAELLSTLWPRLIGLDLYATAVK